MTSVLYCNNYAATEQTVENVKNGLYPRHHLWGIYGLLENPNHTVKLEQCEDMNIIKNRVMRLLKMLRYQINLYQLYKKYDVVFAACAHQIDIFAFAKKIGLFKGRIYTIIHHPCKLLFLNNYDRIFFISSYTFDFFSKNYHIKNGEVVFWGPDLDFYKLHQKNELNKVYDMYSNGKTYRDYSILFEYAKRNPDSKLLVLGLEKVDYENIACEYRVSDIENVKNCMLSKIMVIPIIKNVKAIVGLTSVNDALALGLPMLIANTAHIGFNIHELGLGLEYDAENYNDFVTKYDLLCKDYESYKHKIKTFIQENNYETFEQKIIKTLLGA